MRQISNMLNEQLDLQDPDWLLSVDSKVKPLCPLAADLLCVMSDVKGQADHMSCCADLPLRQWQPPRHRAGRGRGNCAAHQACVAMRGRVAAATATSGGWG